MSLLSQLHDGDQVIIYLSQIKPSAVLISGESQAGSPILSSTTTFDKAIIHTLNLPNGPAGGGLTNGSIINISSPSGYFTSGQQYIYYSPLITPQSQSQNWLISKPNDISQDPIMEGDVVTLASSPGSNGIICAYYDVTQTNPSNNGNFADNAAANNRVCPSGPQYSISFIKPETAYYGCCFTTFNLPSNLCPTPNGDVCLSNLHTYCTSQNLDGTYTNINSPECVTFCTINSNSTSYNCDPFLKTYCNSSGANQITCGCYLPSSLAAIQYAQQVNPNISIPISCTSSCQNPNAIQTPQQQPCDIKTICIAGLTLQEQQQVQSSINANINQNCGNTGATGSFFSKYKWYIFGLISIFIILGILFVVLLVRQK